MTAWEWLQKAKEEKWALGAFNVGSIETFKAIAQAASKKRSPVIIEVSPGETSWLGMKNVVDLAHNFSLMYEIPILVNLDHAESFVDCQQAIDLGFDLIHFDGSNLPYEENLQLAQKITELAHQKGLVVEVEMDHIVGSSEVHSGSAQEEMKGSKFTDPGKAREFIELTGADVLAAFFGNVHGVFEEGGENLHLAVLESLAGILPKTFFSLHGGSGIPDEQVKDAIARGVIKVNVNTEIRQAFRHKLEDVLKNNPSEYAIYKLEGPVVAEVQKVVEHKIEVFGSVNKI